MACRRDDLTRTQLRAQLAEMRPCELVLPSAPLSEATRRVLKAALRSPRTSRYAAPDAPGAVLDMLQEKGYFCEWPEVLKVPSFSFLFFASSRSGRACMLCAPSSGRGTLQSPHDTAALSAQCPAKAVWLIC